MWSSLKINIAKTCPNNSGDNVGRIKIDISHIYIK